MLLRQQGQYNNLSDDLRNKLVEKVKGFGKSVRYKFDISNKNPDPEKYGGVSVIWPNMYILDPATFYIKDPFEKRQGVSQTKRVGLIHSVNEKGDPIRFEKIKVDGKYRGILKLEIEEISDHFDYAMIIEMHPKLIGGDFSDKAKRQMITRIDEQAAAREARAARTERKKALDAVESMSDKDLIDFADAMIWDSAQDPQILRNMAEELAETNPVYFNEKVSGKTVEYQAAVKQAMNKGAIIFDPAEYSFRYGGNKQIITTLSPAGDKNEVEKFAEWLQVGGSKGEQAYKKINELIKV
jgi:hypothetical protein